MNVVHIESRRSKRRNSEYEIAVDIQCDDNRLNELMAELKKEVAVVKLSEFELGLDAPQPSIINESFGNVSAIS